MRRRSRCGAASATTPATPWTDLGGEPAWGTVRPSLGDVDRQAVALASFAAAVAGYFGTARHHAARTGRPTRRSSPWLRRLSGAVDASALSAGTPLATMATRAGALDIAATTDAERGRLLGGDRFEVNYPEPSMWVEAVLAVPDGAAAPDDLDGGDRRDGARRGRLGRPPTAATQSLPGATTMLALRTLWQEAT